MLSYEGLSDGIGKLTLKNVVEKIVATGQSKQMCYSGMFYYLIFQVAAYIRLSAIIHILYLIC